MIMVFTHPLYQTVTAATLLAALGLGGLSPWAVARAGRFGLYVAAASWLLWIIFLPDEGRALFHVLGRPATDAGVLTGLSVALRIASVLFAFLIVAMTTPPRDLSAGLYQLRVPVVFAMVVSIILRLIPQLQAEHAIIVEAQKSRATEFESGGLAARFRKHTAYIIPLALRALKIVSELSIAMEARAFDPYARRTFVRASALGRADWIILTCLGLALAAGIVLRVYGVGGLGSGQ
jgi:energy-coupling factor transport system permease protein